MGDWEISCETHTKTRRVGRYADPLLFSLYLTFFYLLNILAVTCFLVTPLLVLVKPLQFVHPKLCFGEIKEKSKFLDCLLILAFLRKSLIIPSITSVLRLNFNNLTIQRNEITIKYKLNGRNVAENRTMVAPRSQKNWFYLLMNIPLQLKFKGARSHNSPILKY